MRLSDFANKSILILGLGKEGIDSFQFLRKVFPEKKLGLADQLELKKISEKTRKIIAKCKKVKFHLGKNYLKALSKYDIILKTPGIPLEKIKPFLTKKQKVISQTEIFFANCPGKIVGVTGTKGKGTTVSLIYKILKKANSKVKLIGNIGKPVLSFLSSAKKNSIFVYELSSHQLQNLKKSPQIAVFLNLYPAHLDYYQNFKEYQQAKENITLFQETKNWFVYNKDQKSLRKLAQRTKAQKVSFGLQTRNLDCYLRDNWLFCRKEKVMRVSDVPLMGKFNLYNVLAAMAVANLLNIPFQTIKKAIKEFKPLPHRLEFVARIKGREFYNDSLATVPEATIFAIETLKKNLQTLMVGGYEAKQDFRKLARTIIESKIENLILFPSTGERIWNEIKKGDVSFTFFFVDNMKDAVYLAFLHTDPKKICLLSCACPSFGVFKDYKQRGNLFKKYVKKYEQRLQKKN